MKNLDDLRALTTTELFQIRGANERELKSLRDTYDAGAAAPNAENNHIATVLRERFEADVEAAFARAGKTAGALTVTLDGGLVAKADIPKKVKWDQAKLQAIAAGLPWAQVAHLFKIEFTVPEAKFKALMPGELRDAVAAARDETTGALKFDVAEASPPPAP